MRAAVSVPSPPPPPPPRRHGTLLSTASDGSGGGGHALRPSVVFSAQRLAITVGGCAAFYSAELTCAPDHPVTISPSNLPTCIRVSPSLQVFTRANWSARQCFRVAAVGGAMYDDSAGSKDERKFVQAIEHVCSSTDARFHGHRPLLVPTAILVRVSPRDGSCVVASGRGLATAAQLGKDAALAAHHAFRPLELEPAGGGGRAAASLSSSHDVVARSAMVDASQRTRSSIAAVAAVDAANAAAHHLAQSKRGSTRRSLLRGSIHGDDATSVRESVAAADGVGKDAHSFIKVACRKNQTVLLHRSGQVVVLGKRDVEPTAVATARSPPRKTAVAASARADDSSDDVADAALSKMLTDVDCGDGHVVATTEHGYLLTWGDGRDGCLGHGHGDGDVGRAAPRLVKALLHKRVVQVACGARHTLALAEDGDVFAWGYGKSGALGLAVSAQSKAAAESVALPMEVLTLKQRGVAKIACGDLHSAAVLTTGALLTCGWAEHGRLGRPTAALAHDGVGAEYSSCFAPVDLKGRLCTFVACGGAHTLALTACRALLAFGSNGSGQLGLGDCRHRATPTRVAYFGGDNDERESRALELTGVSAGKLHSLATAQDARVFAWGSDEFGQCGVGSFPQIYTVPHLVASTVGLGVTQAAGGDGHSVLLCHGSQRQLDALEAGHPARYAQLMDKFEACVREDKARRTRVLLTAKQRQQTHEAAVRSRRPPLDPSRPRGPAWQSQLQAAANAAQALVESARGVPVVRPPRPHTASDVSRAMVDRSEQSLDSRARTPFATPPLPAEKTKVRCSSATLWRQTRLFTFQAATHSNQAETPPRINARGDGIPTSSANSSKRARPRSALKLAPHARQALGRMFHDDGERPREGVAEPVAQRGRVSAAAVTVAAAQFAATRPKSAPSRAAVAASTRAS